MRQTQVLIEGVAYIVGRSYTFSELPKQAKEDAASNVSDEDDIPPGERVYRLKLEDPEVLADWMVEVHGGTWSDVERMLNSRSVIDLAEDIDRNGLISPPVGSEGFHRVLAALRLGWETMPYFEIE